MIQRMSHSAIFVMDQDVAKDFYVNKLGFELKMDQSMPNGFRWLTVSPKGQPDLEIILMKVAPSHTMPGNTAKVQPQDVDTIAELMKKGAFGAGVFQTADCRKTYEELKGKGVEFVSAPKDQFYGVEAVFKDPFGNWFSMTQPK
ncbi:MAG TPA: VOC family protein [Candidatus Limnocylindrales bacterium]|jgi:catechol 2,3-dioxygenase-like lactoylglutathione lyase family enzyme|nr:VOC family protein [Candidatus Limnocylindrales bacterium]